LGIIRVEFWVLKTGFCTHFNFPSDFLLVKTVEKEIMQSFVLVKEQPIFRFFKNLFWF
jgi:hypothetical protein